MEYPQDVDVDGHEALKEEGDEIDSESDLTTQLGVMKVDNNRSFYVGEAHWAAVLKDVSYDNGQSYIDLLRLMLARLLKSETSSQTTRSSTMTKC